VPASEKSQCMQTSKRPISRLMLFRKRTGDYYYDEGTRWHSWLRHDATSRKVAGSIREVVTETFHWHNPSGHTMGLGLIQPLTEMSTRNISWGVKAAWSYGWQSYHLHVLDCLEIWDPQGLTRPVMDCFTFTVMMMSNTWIHSRQCSEPMNVNLGGTYINHCALKGNVCDYS